jgi:hypothetical protein
LILYTLQKDQKINDEFLLFIRTVVILVLAELILTFVIVLCLTEKSQLFLCVDSPSTASVLDFFGLEKRDALSLWLILLEVMSRLRLILMVFIKTVNLISFFLLYITLCFTF